MSEEILRALMQLFAIIAKQDEGVETAQVQYVRTFLKQQLNEEEVREYFTLFEQHAELADIEEERQKNQLTSVKDSVRILGLCKKINKTLTQKQKIVVLVRLFEIVNADRKFTDQRMAIINTVAEVFKISKEEFDSIELFVIKNLAEELDNNSILIINDRKERCEKAKKIHTKQLDENIFILRIQSVDLYFLKYTGTEDVLLNGLAVRSNRIYLFANGSTIKLPKGTPVYYTDVASHFLEDITASKITFTVKGLEYKFPNGNIGFRNIDFSEGHGRLIGIMGASGAGKTTLLNTLSGIDAPTNGKVVINGIDLHKEKNRLEGVIGVIPQDDLLIEELTVFENLYYNAKLCFKNKPKEEITQLVHKTLINLGLYDRKDLKVGSPLKKMISGGQRKRLNIALELIREPSILFVDEPTSGLSSRDSENVMDLLRELTLKGKLIFVVIHQPSSEIYKMFDKMIILDTGGYMIYYGNPIEGVMYFKRLDAQINSEIGECPTCGNVNPELIFNIIEAKVVDEFGNYTDTRKVSPLKWEEQYQLNFVYEEVKEIKDNPPKNLNIPNWFTQLRIYSIRDLLSKISNTQYIALNLLEAPVLGFILSFIIRYVSDPETKKYIFRENNNISIYIFMALIVALFLGLMVSAEEIFKDRKILKREAFLNLSRSSYLISKVIILFIISAIQTFLFVLIANSILEIGGMGFKYWFALFSTAAFANLLGLNISASFNSAVTIYILIPLIMIPMMILSGAMFSFDKLNPKVSRIDKVPFIAEFMVTKWTYEALMVNQFKHNKFNKLFYDLEKTESQSDFNKIYYIPSLKENIDSINNKWSESAEVTIDDFESVTKNYFLLVYNEIKKQNLISEYIRNNNPKLPANKRIPIPPYFENLKQLKPSSYNDNVARKLYDYLKTLDAFYGRQFQIANKMKENKIIFYEQNTPKQFRESREKYHNEGIEDIVKKVYEKHKILPFNNQLIQHIDPIFKDPVPTKVGLDFRSHFLSPKKYFLGKYYETFWFNLIVVWILIILLYIALYYNGLLKLITIGSKIKFKK